MRITFTRIFIVIFFLFLDHCAMDSGQLLKSMEGILLREESSLESIGFRLNELSTETKTSLLKLTTILQI